MQEYKKCDREGCESIIRDRNKKTNSLKKYCSDVCRYFDHSLKLTKHPQSADAPICAYHFCSNLTEKKTTGHWQKYCCPACRNKQVAYEKSDYSKGPAPKCKNIECNNIVTEGQYGHWHVYCSRKCAGKTNSLLSRNKAKTTCLERFGVENPSLSTKIVKKIQATKKANYDPYSSKTLSHLTPESISRLLDKNWLENENKTKSLYVIAEELGLSASSLGVRFKAFGLIPSDLTVAQSQFEKEIREYLESFDTEVIFNTRKIIPPKEIDIYLPEFNLGIECNGTYWHSELQGKDRKYHLNKTIDAKKNGVDIIHITDIEWKFKQDIIKSIIRSRLGRCSKLHGRLCSIRRLTKEEEKLFFNVNHIQGFVGSNVCYGLIYNREIVSAMSFGKSRFEKNTTELLRFANKLNISVRGSASRLFKRFLEENNADEVLSYSHRDKFTGNLYKSLGFVYTHSTDPSYYYTKDYSVFENRIKYQKHKLSKILPLFDQEISEWDNMKNNGFDRIWDCGNDVWKYNV